MRTLPRLLLFMVIALVMLVLPKPPALHALEFKEVGVGMYAHRDLDLKRGNLEGMGISLGTAMPLWQGHSMRLDLRLELDVGGFWDYATGVEIALLPSLRFYLPDMGNRAVIPFLEGGIGPEWNNLSIGELGTEINFLSFGGLGLRVPLTAANLDVGYRLRHLSNAGMDDDNHGVTSHEIQACLSWPF